MRNKRAVAKNPPKPTMAYGRKLIWFRLEKTIRLPVSIRLSAIRANKEVRGVKNISQEQKRIFYFQAP